MYVFSPRLFWSTTAITIAITIAITACVFFGARCVLFEPLSVHCGAPSQHITFRIEPCNQKKMYMFFPRLFWATLAITITILMCTCVCVFELRVVLPFCGDFVIPGSIQDRSTYVRSFIIVFDKSYHSAAPFFVHHRLN